MAVKTPPPYWARDGQCSSNRLAVVLADGSQDNFGYGASSGLRWWGFAPTDPVLASADLNFGFVSDGNVKHVTIQGLHASMFYRIGWYRLGSPDLSNPNYLPEYPSATVPFQYADRFLTYTLDVKPAGTQYGLFVQGVSGVNPPCTWYTESRFNTCRGEASNPHFALFQDRGSPDHYWVALEDSPFGSAPNLSSADWNDLIFTVTALPGPLIHSGVGTVPTATYSLIQLPAASDVFLRFRLSGSGSLWSNLWLNFWQYGQFLKLPGFNTLGLFNERVFAALESNPLGPRGEPWFSIDTYRAGWNRAESSICGSLTRRVDRDGSAPVTPWM